LSKKGIAADAPIILLTSKSYIAKILKKYKRNALMRKIILSLIFVGAGFLHTSTAQAVTCYAQSPVAWGVGYSFNFYNAQNIAMYECQIRTPYGMYCLITGCNYYQTDISDIGEGGIRRDDILCPETNNPDSPDFDPNCPPTFKEN
jgi:hypothetical protein